MSIKKFEGQVEDLMDKRTVLEENCDSLPQCSDSNGCATCKIFKQIEQIDEEIEKLEQQIDRLMREEED
jgi:archaellum component FlaC